MNHRAISELIPILRQNGVKCFKLEGLEVEFHSNPTAESSNGRIFDFGSKDAGSNPASASKDNQSIDNIVSAIRKQEESLPVDLRADALMDQDKILNWSSPDQKPFEEDQQLPLTGEQPL